MKMLFIGARLFNEVAYFAKSKGIETILTESNSDSPNLDLADKHHIVSRGMEQPMELALSEDVDAVIPLIGIDKPLADVALMKEKLEGEYNLPVVASGVKATEISGDKFKTKKFLIKNKFKTPEYIKWTKSQSTKSDLRLNYPIVLKQSQGQGGVGVKICLSPQDTEDYLKIFPDTMVEEFIKGSEISVEVLRWNQKSLPLVGVYKGETTLTGTHPIEKTRNAPVNLKDVKNQELRAMAQKIMDKLDADGSAEVEFIFNHDKKEITTLEINTRPSGTRFLTYCSTNISPMHQLVNMGMGEWNPKHLEREIKNYFALEMPLPSLTFRSNPQLVNDTNQKKQILTTQKPYIVHGPEKASRITVRSLNMDKSYEIIKSLKL